MNRMKTGSCLALMCAFALGGATATAKSAGGMKTLTGCLQKGTEPDTFLLTNVVGGPKATNKDWELIGVPTSLRMIDHVGHKVSVTGTVVGVGVAAKTESQTTTASDTKTGTTKTETTKTVMAEEHTQRHLKVKSMKHIAATCP